MRHSVLSWVGGAAVAVLLASGPSQAQTNSSVWDKINESGEITCSALADYPPASWKVDGAAQYEGYVINFCRAIAEDLSKVMGKAIKPQFVETTWATVVLDIQSGRIDVGAGLSPTEERLRAVAMPGPAYQLSDVLLYRKGYAIAGEEWEDYNRPEVRVATMTGTVPEKTATEMLPQAERLSFKARPEVILSMQSGRADVHVTTFLGALGALKEAPHLFEGMVVPKPLVKNASHLGVRKDGDGRFAEWLQKWTEDAEASGKSLDLMQDALNKAGLDGSQVQALK